MDGVNKLPVIKFDGGKMRKIAQLFSPNADVYCAQAVSLLTDGFMYRIKENWAFFEMDHLKGKMTGRQVKNPGLTYICV